VPTWALYLDESGDAYRHDIPLREGQKPVFTLAGAALPLGEWRNYQRDFHALKLKFFKNEIDKSSKSLHQWEFKGNRAIAPRNAESERIPAFTHKVLDNIENYAGRLFAVSFVKNHVEPTLHASQYTKALQIVAECFDIFLREKSENARGVIILDSRMAHLQKGSGLDYIVALSLMTYIFGNEQGRQLKRLQEAPLFADSTITAGIQMADIIAPLMYANTYRLQLSPDGYPRSCGYLNYTQVERYWTHLQKLKFQSQSLYQGYRKNGFRVFDHRGKKTEGDTEVQVA
jgi:Protein of unknown function (DUF3800)